MYSTVCEIYDYIIRVHWAHIHKHTHTESLRSPHAVTPRRIELDTSGPRATPGLSDGGQGFMGHTRDSHTYTIHMYKRTHPPKHAVRILDK